MTRTVYGNAWDRDARTLDAELSEPEARARHQAHGSYVAVLHDDDGTPTVVVQVDAGPPVYDVLFLTQGRDTGEYVFVPSPDGDGLRLEQTFIREITGERTVIAEELYDVAVDGTVHHRVRAADQPPRLTVRRIDPTAHPEMREPFPAFGEYDSIARWERGPSA